MPCPSGRGRRSLRSALHAIFLVYNLKLGASIPLCGVRQLCCRFVLRGLCPRNSFVLGGLCPRNSFALRGLCPRNFWRLFLGWGQRATACCCKSGGRAAALQTAKGEFRSALSRLPRRHGLPPGAGRRLQTTSPLRGRKVTVCMAHRGHGDILAALLGIG